MIWVTLRWLSAFFLNIRKKNKQTDCVLVDQEDFENKQFTKLLGVQAEVPSPETDPCEPKLRKHAISLEQRLLPQQWEKHQLLNF